MFAFMKKAFMLVPVVMFVIGITMPVTEGKRIPLCVGLAVICGLSAYIESNASKNLFGQNNS